MYIADYTADYDVTVIMTNMETKEARTQTLTASFYNSRFVTLRLDLRGYEVGMYLMDLSQPQIDLGRHLAYLSYDADNAIETRPYRTYSTNPDPDVVYNG